MTNSSAARFPANPADTADLARVLEQHGVEPPHRPLESFSKRELIALVRQLLAVRPGGSRWPR